ncbi:MAG: filamentous hemagglutinin N-terminal domain-containing protein [Gammaproteobacteria bacterium]|nr:filamentous hemagglutinin N-terminal domain-containing protein [Gammaproteobacteria bacterium]
MGVLTACPAMANPLDPHVIHGSASFARQGGALTVTNSPGAIINWQGFSIARGELTRFLQQHADSAVLNRVTGSDPSRILGQLHSNGRVFLVNPHGIVFGPDAVVDTAGLVASTLNISDEDFLAGKLAFQGDDPGAIENAGLIRARGGDVYLIAPEIRNSGAVVAEGGNILLAAGRRVTITDLGAGGVYFEVQAPEDRVVNLGELLARGGAVRAFAGSLEHAGDIRADSLSVDETGVVVLEARGNVELLAASTVSASGPAGGAVRVESTGGDAVVAGRVAATGSEGAGGDVRLLGKRVGLFGSAQVDASGAAGGGEVRVGGGFQGKDPAVANAAQTVLGPDAVVKADATVSGDGGRVILWADGSTRASGAISARGGPGGGDGGFVEVSGKAGLAFSGQISTAAPLGEVGTVLFDPTDIVVSDADGADGAGGGDGDSDGAISFDDTPEVEPWNVTPDQLVAVGGDIILQADNDITFASALDLGGNALLARAGNNITVATGAGIAAASIAFSANDPGGTPTGSGGINVRAPLDTSGVVGGPINLSTNDGTGIVDLDHDAGSGAVIHTDGGDVFLGNRVVLNQNTLIDTELGDDGPSGLIDLSAGPVSSNGGNHSLVLSTRVAGPHDTGEVRLGRFDDVAGGSFVNVLDVDTSTGASGNTPGRLFLHDDIFLDHDGSTPAHFTFRNGAGTGSAVVVAGNDVTIDTEQGNNIGEDAGDVDFQFADVYGDIPGRSLSVDTAHLNAAVGDFSVNTVGNGDGAGAYLESLTYIGNGTEGAMRVFGGQILTDGGTVSLNGNVFAPTDLLIDTEQGNDGDAGAIALVPLQGDQVSAETAGLSLTLDSSTTAPEGVAGDISLGEVNGAGGAFFGSLTLSAGNPDGTPAQQGEVTLNRDIALDSESGAAFSVSGGAGGRLTGPVVIDTDDGNDGPAATVDLSPVNVYAALTALSSSLVIRAESGAGDSLVSLGLVDNNGGEATATHLDDLTVSGAAVILNDDVTVFDDIDFSTSAVTVDEVIVALNGDDATFGSLRVVSGSLGGTADFVVSGAFDWAGGDIAEGSGGETLTTQGSVNLTTGLKTLARDWVSEGAVVWSGGGLELGAPGSLRTINLNDSFEIQGDLSLTDGALGGSGIIVGSEGSLRKTSGAGTASIAPVVENLGTVGVDSGTLALWPGFSNSGGVEVEAGASLAVSDGEVFGGMSNSGTVIGGGTLAVSTLDTAGGTFIPVDGLATQGVGVLTIDGDVNWGDGNQLDIDLAGSGGIPGVDNDQLAITGVLNATGSAQDLGTLDLNAAGGFVAALGDTFDVMTCGSGCDVEFATVNQPADFTVDLSQGPSLVQLNVASEGEGCTGGSICWTGDGEDGLWTTAENWSLLTLPDAADEVFIDLGGGTSVVVDNGSHTISSVFSAEDLLFSGGSLTISGAAEFTGPVTVNGGTLELNGSSTAVDVDLLAGSLQGSGELATSGTVRWLGGSLDTTLANAGTLLLNGSGSLEGTGRLRNLASGLVEKTLGGPVIVSVPVDNEGGTWSDLDADAGDDIFLAGGGAHSGAFQVTAGNVVLTGGVHAFADGADVGGAGTSGVDGATVQVDGGTVTFANGLTLSSGLLQGTGTVVGNVDNPGGTVSPGLSTGILAIEGNYDQGPGGRLLLEVAGVEPGTTGHDQLQVSGTASLGGTLELQLDPGFDPTGRTFELVTYGNVGGSFSDVLNQPADFDLLGLSGGGVIALEQVSDCPVATLCWDGGGDGSTWTDGANWTGDAVPGDADRVLVSAGVTVSLAGSGPLVLDSLQVDDDFEISNASLTVANDAAFLSSLSVLTGGVLILDGPTSVGALRLAGGAVQGDGDVTVAGLTRLAGGTLGGGGGRLLAEGGLNLTGSMLLNRAVVHRGTGFWSDGGQLGGSGTLRNEGTINAAYASGNTAVFGPETGFDNTGTFIKTGAGQVGVNGTLRNAGTIDLRAGGLSAAGTGSLVQTGTFRVAAGTQLALGASTTFAEGARILNAGEVVFDGGNVVFDGAIVMFGGGRLINLDGVITLSGGTLGGTGTIAAELRNTGGIVSPGASPGTLTVEGDYVQGPDGTLSMELAGTQQGIDHDFLDVTGDVALGGLLLVTTLDGFAPASGSEFELIGAGGALSGDFATLVAPAGFEMTGTPLAAMPAQYLVTLFPGASGGSPEGETETTSDTASETASEIVSLDQQRFAGALPGDELAGDDGLDTGDDILDWAYGEEGDDEDGQRERIETTVGEGDHKGTKTKRKVPECS